MKILASRLLKTLKGSRITRCRKFGVGKEIGGKIYFHKLYRREIIPDDEWDYAVSVLEENYPNFRYNCIRYDPVATTISFQQAPDFNTASEPVVGDYVTVNCRTGKLSSGHSNSIWHHKWLWVKDDYTGFDVDDSFEWSRLWLSQLPEPADGSNRTNWFRQLNKYNIHYE